MPLLHPVKSFKSALAMEILYLSPPEEVIKTRNETGITQKLASARLQSKSANRLMSMINVAITEPISSGIQ